jgi:ribosomal protein S18 acetylase RimI-like enzyme
MNLRPTIKEDRDFLVELFKEEGVLSGFPMTTSVEVEDSCTFWIDMAIKGYGFTCLIDNQIAGMVVLYIPLYSKLSKASLFSIVVSKEFRRQNVATKLIEAIEHLGVKTYGLSIIHLEVYEKNEPAIALYKKLGYKQYGIQEKFIKENDVYYSKILMEKRF